MAGSSRLVSNMFSSSYRTIQYKTTSPPSYACEKKYYLWFSCCCCVSIFRGVLLHKRKYLNKHHRPRSTVRVTLIEPMLSNKQPELTAPMKLRESCTPTDVPRRRQAIGCQKRTSDQASYRHIKRPLHFSALDIQCRCSNVS